MSPIVPASRRARRALRSAVAVLVAAPLFAACDDGPSAPHRSTVDIAGLLAATAVPDIALQPMRTAPTPVLSPSVAVPTFAPSACRAVGAGAYRCPEITVDGVRTQVTFTAYDAEGRAIERPTPASVHSVRVQRTSTGVLPAGRVGPGSGAVTLSHTEELVIGALRQGTPLVSGTSSTTTDGTLLVDGTERRVRSAVTRAIANLAFEHGKPAPTHWPGSGRVTLDITTRVDDQAPVVGRQYARFTAPGGGVEVCLALGPGASCEDRGS
jgi:hypothetical protein